MALSFQTGSPELNYNTAVIPPPWQGGNTSLLVNDHHSKKRKLEPIKTNVNKSQAKPPVFSSYRGETRSLEYAPTGVVNSRYD